MGFTDVHAHFLPGVDDGPATLAEALAAARTAVEGGTSVAFATPHVSRGMPFSAERRDLIAERYALLTRAIEDERLPLDLRLGYEVTPWPQLLEVDPHDLRLGDLPFVLVDCPFVGWRDDIGPFVDHVVAHGLRPILAHPERNDLIQASVVSLTPWRRRALLQVNSSSLLGTHGPEARATAADLVRRGWAALIASDGHDGDRRPHRVDEGYEAARRLVGERAADLVSGAALREPAQRQAC
jgi:protein-tyrosine phosphatase